ncbi:DUF3263 domain-containing protein [Mycolicibacterium peregrinum]|uniref:DUF3263 domain-containing protein n=1 Tax=Mycolicibacterium peregrinum TaxID=43304 RepID=UPI0009EE2D02
MPRPRDRARVAAVGGKEDAIRELGLAPVRCYQLLANLITSRTALEYDSVTVKRIRRTASKSPNTQ